MRVVRLPLQSACHRIVFNEMAIAGLVKPAVKYDTVTVAEGPAPTFAQPWACGEVIEAASTLLG
jgi:hypothetical protein